MIGRGLTQGDFAVPGGIFADPVLRVGAAYSIAKDAHRLVAGRGGDIVAVSPDPAGLDGLIGDSTAVWTAPDLTLPPAFDDAHEHLLEAAQNPEHRPCGRSSKHRRIRERDPPRRREVRAWALGPDIDGLERVEPGRGPPPDPRRGGCREPGPIPSCAARRAPRDRQLSSLAGGRNHGGHPNPAGGSIGRGGDGELNGVLEGAAVYTVLAFGPAARHLR